MKPKCMLCGELFARARADLDYKLCLECGDIEAKKVTHCAVPMNKCAYMLVTDREILKQLNPKRTV
jgi:hypothetical protein